MGIKKVIKEEIEKKAVEAFKSLIGDDDDDDDDEAARGKGKNQTDSDKDGTEFRKIDGITWPLGTYQKEAVFVDGEEQRSFVGLSSKFFSIAEESRSSRSGYHVKKELLKDITVSDITPQVAVYTEADYTRLHISFGTTDRRVYEFGFKNMKTAEEWERMILASTKPTVNEAILSVVKEVHDELVQNILDEKNKEQNESKSRYYCMKCGNLLDYERDSFCTKCGEPVSGTARMAATLKKSNVSCQKYSKLIEIFALIRKGSFDEAESLLNKVSSADIRIGEAYLGKILIIVKARKISDLKKQKTSLSKLPYFDASVRYSDPEIANYLRMCERQVYEKNKNVGTEKKYNEAKEYLKYLLNTPHAADDRKQEAKWLERWEKLRSKFESLKGYKDSYKMMQICDEKIAESTININNLSKKSIIQRIKDIMD